MSCPFDDCAQSSALSGRGSIVVNGSGGFVQLKAAVSAGSARPGQAAGAACHAMRMKTLGWPYPFRPRPWQELLSRFNDLAEHHDGFRHMAGVVASVIQADAAERLAGMTSMHDLIVVPQPIPEPPYDVVAVRAPGSLVHVSDGCVVIEHLSCTGRNDRIERPVADAVPLFWRFMIEKYGVQPVRPGSVP